MTPLGLNNFFPCPKPAYASLSNDNLFPVQDYLQYETLASELDTITRRIEILTKALRVTGVYDSTMQAIGQMLSDKSEGNKLYAVAGMSDLLNAGSTGGKLMNVIQFMPLDTIAAAMIQLYQSRDQTKQALFEISGLSDIMRGQVDPREKLGQTRIKGQYASGRLDRRRKKVARVARDVIRIKAEIIAEKFAPQTLRELSGFDLLPEVVAAEQGQPGISDQIFERVVQLLQHQRLRDFRIDIETDSTVEIDQQAAKETRTELLSAISPFFQQAVPLIQAAPEAAPMIGALLTFVIRGFRAGRNIESAFDTFADTLAQASQPQQGQPGAEGEPEGPPQPTPEEIQSQVAQGEAQAKMQEIQMKLAGQAQKQQADQQAREMDMEMKQVIAQLDAQEAMTDLEIKKIEHIVAQRKAAIQAAQAAGGMA